MFSDLNEMNMMLHPKIRLALMLVVLLLAVAPLQAQEEAAEGPLVVFIEGRALNSAIISNRGRIGASALADIFRGLGARVQQLEPTSPIPPDAQVAVLVRPLRTLRPANVARLWAHLNRGGSVLLAFDPENFFLGSENVSTRLDRSGLPELLAESYGIQVGNGMMIAPAFTSTTISELSTTYSLLFADRIPNPVTEPLRATGVPVWIWGARPMLAFGLGMDSRSFPLLSSDDGYAESDPAIFSSSRETDPPPVSFAFDSPNDLVGRISFAAMSENRMTGGRVIILGDTEMLLNSYGLLQLNNRPALVGNYVFAQRAAAWLLRLPEDDWPSLPPDFTWLAIDGQADDWLTYDTILNVTAANFVGRGELRAVTDDQYLYLAAWPLTSDDDTLTLTFDNNLDRQIDTTVIAGPEGVTLENAGQTSRLDDASLAQGRVIELRLPLRYLPANSVLGTVYIGTADDPRAGDLTTEVKQINTIAPSGLSSRPSMLVTLVSDDRVNLRSGPGTTYPALAQIEGGTVFEALARSADAEWILVENARYRGWIAQFLLLPNGSLRQLPVEAPLD